MRRHRDHPAELSQVVRRKGGTSLAPNQREDHARERRLIAVVGEAALTNGRGDDIEAAAEDGALRGQVR